jgi:Carboxypeptidase regulatory-like domain
MARSGSPMWLRQVYRLRVQFLGLWPSRAVLLTAPSGVFDFRISNLDRPCKGGRTRGKSLLNPRDFHQNIGAISCMKKFLFVASSLALVLLGSTVAVWSADIVGAIVNPSGSPLTGVTVSVQNQAGAAVSSGVTDESGQYVIHGLAPGTYTLISQGQTAVAYVGDQGLTVDWGIASNSQVIAAARQGTGQSAVSSAPNSR